MMDITEAVSNTKKSMLYSEFLWEHYRQPYNNFKPAQWEAQARKINPVCPDILEFFVQLERQQPQIIQLFFVAEACVPVIALASMICERAQGKQLNELSQIKQQDLADWIGPLPPNKRHAVGLVHMTIKELLLAVEAICRYSDK